MADAKSTRKEKNKQQKGTLHYEIRTIKEKKFTQ